MTAGFVGAGKAGCSLGKYLALGGVELAGYYSRNPASAAWAGNFTCSPFFSALEDLAEQSDIIFLTVPDGQIITVWEHLRCMPLAGKIICHCSGSLPSTAFTGIDGTGAFGGSLHPICALSSREAGYRALEGASFTLEGPSPKLMQLQSVVEGLGNPIARIAPEHKTLYHAACVSASNLMVGLCAMGRDLLAGCGLDADFAERALASLLRENVEHICRDGIVQALTGPLERGDVDTIGGHLSVLEGPYRDTYTALSKILLDLAREKHPEQPYTEVAALLENNRPADKTNLGGR